MILFWALTAACLVVVLLYVGAFVAAGGMIVGMGAAAAAALLLIFTPTGKGDEGGTGKTDENSPMTIRVGGLTLEKITPAQFAAAAGDVQRLLRRFFEMGPLPSTVPAANA
jgi:hypothetical protein